MKPARQLLTVSFVLLFSACAKDSIDVGSTAGAGGTTTVEGASGGATTDPVGTGGTSSGVGGAAVVPGAGGDTPVQPSSGGATTAPVGTGGTRSDGVGGTGGPSSVGVGGAGAVPGAGGVTSVQPSSGGATTAPVGTGGTSSRGTGGVGGLGTGGVGGVGGAAGVPSTGLACVGPNIVAEDANNYTIATSLVLAPVKVKAVTDLTFDWSGVTADLGGRAVAPATDIAMVYVMVFDLSLTGLQNKLNTDTLAARDLLFGAPITYYPKGGKLAARLSEFSLGNTSGLIDLATLLEYFDPAKYPPESTSYLMVASAGTVFLEDFLMMQAFQPDTATSNTIVAMGPHSTTMSFSVDLRSLTPIGVPAGRAALTLDFGQAISRTGLGGEWDPSSITSAIIGHYTQNLSELEAGIFNLDLLATDYFRIDIASGTTVDFAALKTAAEKRFTGIDSTGTWLLGLLCGSCRNPAPWFVTILRPCGSP